jgi:hypothetical protein
MRLGAPVSAYPRSSAAVSRRCADPHVSARPFRAGDPPRGRRPSPCYPRSRRRAEVQLQLHPAPEEIMPFPKFIEIDGKRHLWRDVLQRRCEQLLATKRSSDFITFLGPLDAIYGPGAQPRLAQARAR